MRVYQAPIAGDPLLGRMAAALAAEPRPKVTTFGDGYADLGGGPPDGDLDTALSQSCASFPIAFDPGEPGVIVRAAIYYPRNGWMGWHTNSARAGWRAYVPRGDIGLMLTEAGPVPDRPGYANVFQVPAWHAVCARGERWALGVLLPAGHRLIPGPHIRGW